MLRQDPITGRWVIVAKNRAARPHEFETRPVRRGDARCPFCAGNEGDTPPTIASYPPTDDEATPWQVRVVENLYPALQAQQPSETVDDGIFRAMGAVGTHEVVVESPRHVASLADLTPEEAAWAFQAYRDRIAAVSQRPELAYAQVFKNVRPAAGASLEHTHSQLIATPVVPIIVQEELDGSQRFFTRQGRCVWCAMLDQELAEGTRIVAHSEHFVAFCPFAARFPFETWIVPVAHADRFEQGDDEVLRDAAAMTREVVGRIERALDCPAYNYLIHTAPFDTRPLAHYHWHIEVFPRLTKAAGFEWGTGYYINPAPPEEAADELRRAGGDFSV